LRKEKHKNDCLFSIECKSIDQAEDIKEFILGNWLSFKENYSGTGALYSTLEKMQKFINNFSTYNSEEKLRQIAV